VDLGIVMTKEDGTTYKLYWAKSNLSTSGLCANPEDYGDYYAWGETSPKSVYSFSTYKWCNGTYDSMTKYNTNSQYGTVDNKTVLDLEDDVAHVKLGGKWRMPTYAEWTALREKSTWTWTTRNDVNGILVTASNGNSIFLPAAGCISGASLRHVGSDGYYRSSSLNAAFSYGVWDFCFDSDEFGSCFLDRFPGQSIRPVSE
jgi:hypothetical protein